MYRNNGMPVGFHVRGHAEYGDYGEDIVCSAVSAVVQTAILGISDVLCLKADINIHDGEAICMLDNDVCESDRQNAALIMSVMIKGLRSIQASYPRTLRFRSKEVYNHVSDESSTIRT